MEANDMCDPGNLKQKTGVSNNNTLVCWFPALHVKNKNAGRVIWALLKVVKPRLLLRTVPTNYTLRLWPFFLAPKIAQNVVNQLKKFFISSAIELLNSLSR